MSHSIENTTKSFDTKATHAGQEHDNGSHSEIIPPVVTSVTFYQKDPTNIFVVIMGFILFISPTIAAQCDQINIPISRAIVMVETETQHVMHCRVAWRPWTMANMV